MLIIFYDNCKEGMIAAPATANVAVIAKMTSNNDKGDIHGNGGSDGLWQW